MRSRKGSRRRGRTLLCLLKREKRRGRDGDVPGREEEGPSMTEKMNAKIADEKKRGVGRMAVGGKGGGGGDIQDSGAGNGVRQGIREIKKGLP